MLILSQLFWGVTVGALTETALLVGRGLLGAVGLGGAAWWGMKWRNRRKKRSDDSQ
jgi:hypothetical protein